MNNRFRQGMTFALILVIGLLSAGVGLAHDSKPQASPAASPMASPGASPAAMSTGAVFLTISNSGESADRLLSAATDLTIAVEIHEVADEGGVMKMRPLTDGLEIPAGESVELMPGGFHIMLIGLKGDLVPGDSFELVLTFERAGEIAVIAQIVMGNDKPAEGMADPVTEGDITVSDVWSRGAPAMHS